ncbi:MAG: nuclear transport factor 2 family protein [Deltaproteobacteria bacterium]|nr:nuclear transport factor 2 family protein [Deltaproteobacteria bacterium]
MSATADRAAIEALIYGYAERIDAGDLAGVGALFAKAVYRGAQGGTYRGAAEVAAVLTARVILYDGVPRTRHVTTNLVIELDPAGASATARSYFTVFQAAADLPLQPIVAGRYHDRFVRDGDQWRFDDRLIFMDLFGDLRRHLRG